MKIGARVGLMARYVFWAQVVHMQFLGPKPQGREIFYNFMILLVSYYDSGENEVLIVKIEARSQTYSLIFPLGPNCPKLVFRPQTPNVSALGSKSFFKSRSIKFA